MSSVISLSLVVSSEQRGNLSSEQRENLSVFRLEIPLHSNWSYSDSIEYLIGVSAAVAAHSLLLLIAKKKLLKKGPAVSSRGHAWILFVSDQAFAYAMIKCWFSCSWGDKLEPYRCSARSPSQLL